MFLYKSVKTAVLDVAYLEWNPDAVKIAVLIHGWPDSPTCWKNVAPVLAESGYRVLAPALRGYYPTKFLSAETPRSGQLSALGQDLLDYLDALNIKRAALIGHDWGARAAANACGLREEVATHLVMLSVGYGTNGPGQSLALSQAQNFWYQWYLASKPGEQALWDDRVAFAKRMWDTWSPSGWYDDRDFHEAAEAFQGDDWPLIVMHSYRHRWAMADSDPAYADAEAALSPAPTLSIPVLMLHGGADTCTHPSTSEGKEGFFTGRYERHVLPGVGHFPQREAGQAVVQRIRAFLR
ncbi:alpha/beta hydrolase [Pseudomonas sp. BN605]|uniref:Alpha/beta hydrolase n=1 Tax=Pseudomonas hunanensis TaxID=1247546 RepID=A0ABD6MZQ7_9PSED|nr:MULTISPECIES: alpha/beta hydrolase [Pseudomonas]MDH4847961.1 alpha/beta hydrolase [Pseudomonas sp. BN605]NWL45610.1 alpha/beta hydrolase [Pseudomonas hunanensis]